MEKKHNKSRSDLGQQPALEVRYSRLGKENTSRDSRLRGNDGGGKSESRTSNLKGRKPNPENRTSSLEAPVPSPGSQVPSPGKVAVQPTTPNLSAGSLLRGYQLRWVADPARFAIAVKSAQIGYSTATAAWAVDRCLSIPRRNIIFLSRSERQALELGEKAKAWVDGFKGIAADWSPNHPFGGTSVLQHEIRFGNGSRIIVLAANPDTARGYTGDVVLDEFAFHKDSQAIFTAVYRQVSLGFSMRILSTPNGQQGKFYELAKQLGMDSGVRPAVQPVRARYERQETRDKQADSSLVSRLSPLNPWSGHWCDIFMAIEDGLPLDAEEVRGGCDDDTWLQEYCCQFISQASEWITPELFQQCVSSEASTDFPLTRLATLGPLIVTPK